MEKQLKARILSSPTPSSGTSEGSEGSSISSPISPSISSASSSGPSGDFDPSSCPFFSLTLKDGFLTDYLRLSPSSPEVEAILTSVVTKWGGALSLKGPSNKAYTQYDLRCTAWSEFRTDNESIFIRSFLVVLLTKLAENGWNFCTGIEVTKSERGKDVLFFEKGALTPGEGAPVEIFAINFPKSDRIKLIGPSFDVITAVGVALAANWKKGVKEGLPGPYRSFEFKLNGFPWLDGKNKREPGNIKMKNANLLLALLRELRGLGFRVYGSIRITKKEKEMPTIFFKKERKECQ